MISVKTCQKQVAACQKHGACQKCVKTTMIVSQRVKNSINTCQDVSEKMSKRVEILQKRVRKYVNIKRHNIFRIRNVSTCVKNKFVDTIF